MPYVLEPFRLHAKCKHASEVCESACQTKGKAAAEGTRRRDGGSKAPNGVKLRRVRMDVPERYYGTIGH